MANVQINKTNLGREGFDGTVLAETVIETRVEARGAATFTVPAEVAAFGDPRSEAIVAEPDAAASGFATAFRYGAEIVGQRLEPRPLRVEAEAAEGGRLLRVTATSLARDVFCPADTVDAGAAADVGMFTLRAGQSARIRIHSPAGGDPEAFGAAVRCANDLL